MAVKKRKFKNVDTTKMTNKEAMRCTKNIKTKSMALQKALLDFFLRNGYEAMGYGSFKEYCVEEVTNASYDSLNNALNTAKITLDMAGIERVGRYSSYALSPLKNYSSAERREVYRLAQKESEKDKVPSKFLSKKFVKSALVILGYEDPAEPDKPETTNESDENAKSSGDENIDKEDSTSTELRNEGNTKFEREFMVAWNKTPETNKFPQRIVKAISASANPNLVAKMCLYLLKENFEGDEVDQAIKLLKKSIVL